MQYYLVNKRSRKLLLLVCDNHAVGVCLCAHQKGVQELLFNSFALTFKEKNILAWPIHNSWSEELHTLRFSESGSKFGVV